MSDEYPAWRARLVKANDPVFWPIEAIDDLLARGAGQFWSDGQAALVTHVVAYPGGARAVESIAAAGRGKSLVEVIAPAVEQWAKAAGLTHMIVSGRAGWTRKLRGEWRHTQSTIVRELA